MYVFEIASSVLEVSNFGTLQVLVINLTAKSSKLFPAGTFGLKYAWGAVTVDNKTIGSITHETKTRASSQDS